MMQGSDGSKRRTPVPGVLFASIVVGTIYFFISLVILTLIAVEAGFLKLLVFGPPLHPQSWPKTMWVVVTWVGSSCSGILSSWAFFRVARKLSLK